MVALALVLFAGTLGALPSSAAAALYRTDVLNGDFATGDLRGFRAEGLEGAGAEVVTQGTSFSGVPGSETIPFPNGPGSHAVKLRSRGDGTLGSVAILTSLPFVPASDTLSFKTFSESTAVAFEVLILDPAADTLEPSADHIQSRLPVVVDRTHTDRAQGFAEVRVPLPRGPRDPVKVQFRQQTLEPLNGFFTLVTDIRSGPPVVEADRDRDGVPDAIDNCPSVANVEQTDSDHDRHGDACDNCVYDENDDQLDTNGDGIGNRCTVDIDGDGFTGPGDVEAFGAAIGGASDRRCDLSGDGRVDLLDLAIFSQATRIGIESDPMWDFTFAFVGHGVRGGLGASVGPGMQISSMPGSELIAFPGPFALLVRSNDAGDPASEGILTSRPFVPRGPHLMVRTLSESPSVIATLRVLRPTPQPITPAPEDVLLEVPLRNDAPGSGPGARFQEQHVDLSPWVDLAEPLRSPRIQIQVRQHTTEAGAGFFTLIGDVRTGR